MYDCGSTSSDRNVVVLNDIHIDIMDYIVPASCTETDFRRMWAEFEWENKVNTTALHHLRHSSAQTSRDLMEFSCIGRWP